MMKTNALVNEVNVYRATNCTGNVRRVSTLS